MTTLAVRTLGDGIGGALGQPVGGRGGNGDGLSIGGWDLTDPDSWLLAPVDQDAG